MSATPLQELAAHGQSVWIDDLSRQMLRDGELAALVDRGIVGVTSNPTIFQKAIAEGEAYDDQIRELVAGGTDDPRDIFWALAVDDVRDACDVLHATWEATDRRDGYVSLEVDPSLAYDTDATVREARRLRDQVDRPNLLVKIPATEPGLVAIEETIAAGVAVNVTLIFSLQRHRAVAEAYLRGLERLVDAGGDASVIASVASFFVSRVDTEGDRRIEAARAPQALLGRLAVANARLAYETYEQVFTGERWERLAAAGATPQRCLWASTSVKNPEYRDTLYVESLVGADTVDTMPAETVEAVADHGEISATLPGDPDQARRLLADLEREGISYEGIVETLEREGVEKFDASFRELVADIAAKRDALVSV